MRRSWVEINLNIIKNNYEIYKKYIADNQEIMAVVKADAYGHGDVEVAKALQEIGCNNYAVSNICEAIRLRNAGIKGQILILGYTPIECTMDLVKYDLTQAILSEDYAECMKGNRIKVHFAIDTGMNRIGLDGDDVTICERVIRKYANDFNITGLFTHLCVADTPEQDVFTYNQINKFKAICDKVVDLNISYIHCLNSVGGLRTNKYGNLVRLGIVLYGLRPDYSICIPDEIRPVLMWKSVIAMIKTVHDGETIGYGRTYCVKGERRIATVPTGYADGYNRLLSNIGVVYINGRKAPIVGRVCMDQLMIDVTDISNVSFGDEVILIGSDYTADDMAKTINTIGYEVVCNISKRVERYYV